MRPSIDWKTATGSVALLAAALLASPGVRVVRAEPPGAEIAAGPQCSGTPSVEPGPSPRLDAILEEVRRHAQARRAADPASAAADEAEVVVLNNRGYNYGAAPGVDPAALLRELRAP